MSGSIFFQTVADELQECSTRVVYYFRDHAYAVRIERGKIEYPSLPTLEVKRKQTTILIEVGGSLHLKSRAILEQWVNFGRSCEKDTRIAFASDKQVNDTDYQFLKEKGIGLYLYLNGKVTEHLAPLDLAINLKLPELKTLNVKLRHDFAPIYEKIEKSFWLEAFEDACKLLEESTRKYFIEYSNSGRIKVMEKSGPVTYTKKKIDGLAMGQLAGAFSRIVAPTANDVHIGEALRRINKDRIEVTHRKGQRATHTRLRKNVGRDMWVILGALKLI